MRHSIKLGLWVVPMIMLWGCSTHPGSWRHRLRGHTVAPEPAQVHVSGAGTVDPFVEEEEDHTLAEDPLAQHVYYFETNRSDVMEASRASLAAHAEYLRLHPESRIRLEGHTDERGSREYNIALGERRAKTVADVLGMAGVSREQIAVISYGKEKPAVEGHGESVWHWNRRVELLYEAGEPA